MPYKKFLILATALLLFILSGIGVYAAMDWYAGYREDKVKSSFTAGGVPEEISANFAREFAALRRATEPLMLPDEEFYDREGRKVRFSDFKGQPLLVNFWATWCAPCVVELPSLDALQKYYDGKLQVIAVSMDINKDQDEINEFLSKREIGPFAGYYDMDGNLARTMDMRGIPTSYLIAPDGHILYRFEGDANWASEEARMFFDNYISLSVE